MDYFVNTLTNTTQHNTTQHNTTQHNTTQHNTTQHNTTQHNTTQHNGCDISFSLSTKPIFSDSLILLTFAKLKWRQTCESKIAKLNKR